MAHVSRLAKLRAMSLGEIAVRAAYKGYTAYERRLHRRGLLAPSDRLRRALRRDLAAATDWDQVLVRREAAGSFFTGLDEAEATRARLATEYRDEWRKAQQIADRVAGLEIEFFGKRFQFAGRIDWHADPVTRAPWPRAYHLDVPVVGGDRGFGDVKYVWELNRHQFLIDLAKVALLDGSDRHGRALQTLIEDWQREVPYATGAAWACALEPAFRVWSWLWAYHFMRAAGPLDPAFHLTWLTGFYDHGRFLYRHLETHTSPYNHLVGEASALFALGLLLPELEEARDWVSRGRHVLESTLSSQFHADGGTVEQSTFYHHATLGFYLLAAVLARRNGADLSGDVWQAIERGIDFSMALMQPDGRVPSIGGADDGKPIRLEQLPFWDFRPYQAIGAVLFSRPDFKMAAGRFWEDALWLLGTGGAGAFERLPAETPALGRMMERSGYYVVRSAWAADADYLCFDCGDQAAGLRRDGVPSAAHGHADCLSVIVTLGGRPVLVDPGFFCYNGDPEWEVHFRRTAAHNTITIDERDQARHVSKMAWTHTYAAQLEGMSLDGALGWVRGSHDGYADDGRGPTHRRSVWLRSGGYAVVCDELIGPPGYKARANYQFAPGTLEADDADGVLFAGRFELAWTGSVPLVATLIRGGDDPSGGWIAPSLGIRRRAPRLELASAVPRERAVLVTILADRRRGGSETERRVRFSRVSAPAGCAAVAATINGPGWQDHLVVSVTGAVCWQGIETDAAVAVVRVGDGGIEDSRRIGGTYLRIRGADRATTQQVGRDVIQGGGG